MDNQTNPIHLIVEFNPIAIQNYYPNSITIIKYSIKIMLKTWSKFTLLVLFSVIISTFIFSYHDYIWLFNMNGLKLVE